MVEAQRPKPTNGHLGCLTPQQEEALKHLAQQLPGAAKDAGLTPEQLTIWGVPLSELEVQAQDPAKGGAPGRPQAVVLLKFLRARQFAVPAALEMLINCLKWRRDFDVDGLEGESFPPQLEAGGRMAGRDRAGNPVTYNFYGSDVDLTAVFSNPGGLGSFVRWRVRLMERAVRQLALGSGEDTPECVTQVHDYQGASLFRMDANVKAASRQIIRLFQDNYPEMLSSKLFVNVPYVMEFLFGVMGTVVHAATRAKFVAAGQGRARTTLLAHMHPLQLPERFGGFLELTQSAGLQPEDCKQVTLAPGETRTVSLVVMPGEGGSAPEVEVAWGFITNGPHLAATLVFSPADAAAAGAAAAAAAGAGNGAANSAAPRTLPDRPVTGSTRLVLNDTDAERGQMRVGCAGEVTLTLEYKPPAGWFSTPPPATVYHVLCVARPQPMAAAAAAAGVTAAAQSGKDQPATAAA